MEAKPDCMTKEMYLEHPSSVNRGMQFLSGLFSCAESHGPLYVFPRATPGDSMPRWCRLPRRCWSWPPAGAAGTGGTNVAERTLDYRGRQTCGVVRGELTTALTVVVDPPPPGGSPLTAVPSAGPFIYCWYGPLIMVRAQKSSSWCLFFHDSE
jgi:hypothetical protein